MPVDVTLSNPTGMASGRRTLRGMGKAAALLCAAAFLFPAGCRLPSRAPSPSVARLARAARRAMEFPSAQDSAVELARAQLRREPGSPTNLAYLAAALVSRARAQGSEKDFLEAESALRRSLFSVPQRNDGARVLLAGVFNSQHRFRDALSLSDSVLETSPHNTSALAVRGDALLELGDLEGARQAFNRAEDLDPGPDALSRLARLAELIGDRGHARDWLESCERSYVKVGGEPLAWSRAQLGLLDLKDGRIPGARRRMEASLASAPAYPPALDGLSKCCLRGGDTASAAALLDVAIERCPRADFLGRRADLYARAGDTMKSRQLDGYVRSLYEESYRAGGRGHLRDYSLWLIQHGGDLRQALALARQDSTLRGGAYVDDALARAYEALGNRPMAAQTAARAIRHHPWDPDLLERSQLLMKFAGAATSDAPRRRPPARS